MSQMFCRQCQETAKNSGCTICGVCGKNAETANLQDELLRYLKAISMAVTPSDSTGHFIARSLFMTITNANFDPERIQERIRRASSMLNGAALPPPPDPAEDEDVRSLRDLLIFGLKGVAAYATHAAALGKEDPVVYGFLMKALAASVQLHAVDQLLPLVLECGEIAVRTMALLDSANTSAYGKPEPVSVRTGVGTRPGILVSGHDLRDLKELLEQSKNSGIDIYTHSEMLPAHAYPELRKYPHLYGNYGNAWHRQQTEFESFNGPILMTTNCIVPVKDSYRERIFTTGMAGYPGVRHIPDPKEHMTKNFTEIIAVAQKCAPPKELENGTLEIGYAHDSVLAHADAIVDAVKTGAIKRFIVMAGCDGRFPSRTYYSEVAKKLPPDTVILTAGCAKYRYNKLNLGKIGPFPRVLDAGQCNDSYSLAVIALALKKAFALDDVNKLPLSFDIAWYEQKAVAVLLALLFLGFKKIRLGPTLPAFVSPGIAKVLVSQFGITPISDADSDVASMMRG